ncbi:intracellular septation protein A [compost metagenome]
MQAADNLWVAFKVWGIMPLTIVFSMLQLGVLKDYAPDPMPPTPVPPTVEG